MIDIQNLSYRYAGSKELVFDGFSLQLSENNIYGLLGKNGTGKSTLLYLLAGLLRPTQGSVAVDGMESGKRLPAMLEELFIVPEEFFMSFALAAGTRLLLMDEPTNGLDIPSKTQFRRVVANNMTEDRTLIISTHQVHDVESLLDHILILSRSGLLLNASVGDICESYGFEYRALGSPMDDVVYSEPSMQGNAVISRRDAGSGETQLNLELLFNAVTTGKIQNINTHS